jgi:hypothetical protein
MSETLNSIATATMGKRTRLMAWLSNFGRSFDFSDRNDSLAGIVALFKRTHNLLTRDISISHKRPANQMRSWDNESYVGSLFKW